MVITAEGRIGLGPILELLPSLGGKHNEDYLDTRRPVQLSASGGLQRPRGRKRAKHGTKRGNVGGYRAWGGQPGEPPAPCRGPAGHVPEQGQLRRTGDDREPPCAEN